MNAMTYPTADDLMREKGPGLVAYLNRTFQFYVGPHGPVVDIEPATNLLDEWQFATVTFEDGTYRTFSLDIHGNWYRFRGRGGKSDNSNGGPSYKYTLAEVLQVLQDPTLHLAPNRRMAIEDRLRTYSQQKYKETR